MHSHLNLPYNWIDCDNFDTCQEYIHLSFTADDIKNMPKEWVMNMLPPECLDSEGNITFYNSEGNAHSIHGAAKEWANGNLEWRNNGELHRENGPAVIDVDGYCQWSVNGKLHRTDGPAIIQPGEREEWWLNGQPHRTDGPAFTYADGAEEWWQHGQLHREDGPAIIRTDDENQWWLNGNLIEPPEDEEPLQATATLNKTQKNPLIKRLKTFLRKLAHTRST